MKRLLTQTLRIVALLLGCFSGYFSFSQTYTLNGDAVSYGNGLVKMTSSVPPGPGVWQKSSAWCTTKHDLSQPFDMEFDLFFGCETGPDGGDGITFTFQNEGPNALGAGGGFLGIGGSPAEMIQPSIAIEFDTYDATIWGASNEVTADHIAIDRNGDVNNTNNTFTNASGNSVTVQPIKDNRDLEDCAVNAGDYYTIRVVWDPVAKTLQLYEQDVLTLTFTEDIVNTIFGGNSSVFWGFTSATGDASNEQWIAPRGSIIPWQCSFANSCCAPYSLNKTGPTTICNNPIQLGVADSYVSYEWSTGATTPTINVSAPGFYSLSVRDNMGCPSIDTFTIAPTGPTADISGDATICSDGTTSPVTVTLTGVAPWKITYSEDGVVQDTVTISLSPYVIAGTAPNTYILTSVLDNSGCTGQVSGSATVDAYPGLPVGHDTTFVAPGTAVLNVDNGGGTYEWYDAPTGGNLVFTGPSYTTPVLNDTATYYVIDASIPSFVTKSVALADINDPAAVGSSANNPGDQGSGLPKAVCFLDFTANSDFSFERITCAINVPAGAWTNSTVSFTINDVTAGTTYNKDSLVTTPLTTGVHDFLLSINYDCIAGHTYRISYEGQGPSIQGIMYWSLVTLAPFGTPYHLTADAELDITHTQAPSTRYPGLFDWQISVGSPAAICGRTPVTAFPVIEPPVATEPLFIPNLMTPNKDGKNDFFEIQGLPASSKLQIFNRWGDKVFVSESYNNLWAGDNQSDGMYFFDLVTDDGKAYKGWVQIVR